MSCSSSPFSIWANAFHFSGVSIASLIKDKTEKEIKGKYKFTTNFKMNKITTQKGYAKMIIVLQDGKGLKYTEVVYIKYSSAK